MRSTNPATERIIQEYEPFTARTIESVVEKTQGAFLSWRHTTLTERGSLMHGVADVLRSRAGELSRLMTAEMGKRIAESRAEIEKCAWVCDYYADEAAHMLADEFIETDAAQSYVQFDPIGIVLAVMPWNFPFWQVFRFAAPALMAGNAGLLKHASNVSGCALAIEDVFRGAGFPDALFSTLLVSSDRVADLIGHPYIRAVTLTGSEPAGSAVAARAGSLIKKTVLELGGSDAFLVLEDADVDRCVEMAVTARMINCGQSCIAAKRFIVAEPVAGQFTDAMVDRMRSLSIGDPMNESVQVAPLAREDLLADLDDQVRRSVAQGARLVTGGTRPDRQGYYYSPTVLSGVEPGMAAFDEETFGPLAAISVVRDYKQGIELVNQSRFGLGSAVWTEDIERGREAASAIEAGAVFVNGFTKSDPRLPFGGVKASGYGRELSHFGIREFVNTKSVWIGK